ncbi:ABC transporter substrate-binding protein [Winogradskya humida]|uniref:Amino acid-binding protein n=1 Tax=Winogradskya humida TaxID=113566 RepID=A0ABQ4A2D8_9ACTN|nr:ABC transporter substrate-binding protein [Actinoplanes humidus]GIE24788.1 amino acid-binding protein [Actinoplanes humidus]
MTSHPTLRIPVARLKRMGAALTVVPLLALSGCGGSSLDDTPNADSTITIGAIWAQSGNYTPLGTDMANGFNLYLTTHGNKLGGHPVVVKTADEGDTDDTALAAARKLLDSDRVDVLVGTASAVPTVKIAPKATTLKIPFIGTGGRPSTIKDVSYIWHTSWLSRETGAAIAPYLAQTVKGPVYAIGPAYTGGYDQMGGFIDAFRKVGGKLANAEGDNPNPDAAFATTPYPVTPDFKPYLNKIRASGAKAVYTFYAGGPATKFVHAYRDAGLSDIPLYGAGFLTEGSQLNPDQEGDAATGIQTVLNYAATVPGQDNADFVQTFQAKYPTIPNLYNVTAWDAAALLDQAIAKAGPHPTGETINAAIGTITQINSPRGTWHFNAQHAPEQQYFLREVRKDGRVLSNVVIRNLTTNIAVSAPPAAK